MEDGRHASSPIKPARPFNRVIALDWHDGLRTGLAECTASGLAYSLEFRSWDDQQNRRVYAVSSIMSGRFEELVGLLRSLGLPEWPMWVPIWRFKSRSEQDAAEHALKALLQESLEPMFVVLAEDPSREIIRCAGLTDPKIRKRFEALETTHAPFEAWEAFLYEEGKPCADQLCP